MTKVELPYIQRFKDRHGRLRHYFRKPGCRRVPLPAPTDPAFMDAYRQAVEEKRTAGENRYKPGSVWSLIAAYYQASEFTDLKPQTQKVYRNVLDNFRKEYGDLPANRLDAENIRRILDKKAKTPGAARNLLKRLRGLYAFAVDRDHVKVDPTVGVKLKARKTDGFRAWTDEDIAKFLAHWPAGSRARLALYLLLYTGQRRSDVVVMGHQHRRVTPDGKPAIWVKQKKTGVELLIPLHGTLKSALDALPTTNLTFLMTAYDKPMSEAGFSQWFVESAQAAGLPARSGPHGLRKAASRRLAEAGCSALEIASITGHGSLKEVERYTKSARQALLARAAMDRIANEDCQTALSNPDQATDNQ